MSNQAEGLVTKYDPVKKWGLVALNSPTSFSKAAFFNHKAVESRLTKKVEIGDTFHYTWAQSARGPTLIELHKHAATRRSLVEGMVKWYDYERGYGFVKVPTVKVVPDDVFLHLSVLRIYINYTKKDADFIPENDVPILVEVGKRDGRPVVKWIEAYGDQDISAAVSRPSKSFVLAEYAVI